jgi:hypothetical protein
LDLTAAWFQQWAARIHYPSNSNVELDVGIINVAKDHVYSGLDRSCQVAILDKQARDILGNRDWLISF